MVAYRRSDRPHAGYLIEPTLPKPWGRVGPWRTGMRRKDEAERVERWVRDLALTQPEAIDALVQGRIRLQEAWIAHLRGTLDDLIAGLGDPPLAAAADTFKELVEDERVRTGLEGLAELAVAVEAKRAEAAGTTAPKPGTIRLSWLLAPANVTELYAVAMTRRSAGTVYRTTHRAVADLLAHHYGIARRDAVMAEVSKPQVEDRREVRLTASEVQRLLAVCDPDTRDLIALAMLLAVDLSPLLALTPRLFDEERGLLEVRDAKTKARPRVIEVSTPALAILRRRCAGLGPDDRLFSWTRGQVRHRFEAARDRAAGRPSRNRRERGAAADPIGEEAERLLNEHRIVTLPVLRFKDLRHLLPTAWNALGLPPEDLKGIMGWAERSNMSERYTTARVRGDRKNLDKVAEFLGLDRLHVAAS